MGKYKEIQIEVSDEVYSALEQLADDQVDLLVQHLVEAV